MTDLVGLPAGLSAWAEPLSILPNDLATMLAPWVGRLAIAIGPLAHVHQPTGEPDGYSGLTRRGSYERLLTSEWGVAELFPDEFLRRAASGEHLFVDLARKEPRGGLRSVAIVSAGPSQLGSPRLAHVAALIVLTRRASMGGASFAWGVLEDDLCRLYEGLDEVGLSRLLGARTAVPAGRTAIAAWVRALGDDRARDFWFIGGDADAARAHEAGASRIVVRDVLSPIRRELEVEVTRRGQSAKLRLELPEPDACARLLRDPFARGTGASTRVAQGAVPARSVRFAPGGRRLIVRLDDGSYEVWPIPSSPRDQIGQPRRWTPPSDRSVVAVGVGKRALFAALASRSDVTALELRYGGGYHGRISLPVTVAEILAAQLAAGGELPIGTIALVAMTPGVRSDLVFELCGQLLVIPGFSLASTEWPSRPHMAVPYSPGTPGPVLGSAYFPTSFVWAERGEVGQVLIFEGIASGYHRVATLGARDDAQVMFGYSTSRRGSWGIVSVAWAAEHRRVAGPELKPTTLRAWGPVVGVCERAGVPGLLVQVHAERLAWQFGELRELLPQASAPIVAVAVCPLYPNLAWVTSTGELVVYSMARNAVLFRRQAPGASR